MPLVPFPDTDASAEVVTQSGQKVLTLVVCTLRKRLIGAPWPGGRSRPAAFSRATPPGAGGGPPRLWAWSHFQSHLLNLILFVI